MKRAVFMILTVLLAALVFMPRYVSAEGIKIGYVELSKTFDEYEKTKESDANLEKETRSKETERQTMVDEIKKLKDEIPLLSDKKKEEQQAAVDEKIKALQQFDEEVRNKLKEERDEMVRDILREIDKVIQDYGKSKGYTVILNDRVLLYGEESIDITPDIIDLLNSSYKKGGPGAKAN